MFFLILNRHPFPHDELKSQLLWYGYNPGSGNYTFYLVVQTVNVRTSCCVLTAAFSNSALCAMVARQFCGHLMAFRLSLSYVRVFCEVLNICFQPYNALHVPLLCYHPTAALRLLWCPRFRQQSGCDWPPSGHRMTQRCEQGLNVSSRKTLPARASWTVIGYIRLDCTDKVLVFMQQSSSFTFNTFLANISQGYIFKYHGRFLFLFFVWCWFSSYKSHLSSCFILKIIILYVAPLTSLIL